MPVDIYDLRQLREKVARARTKALRLGNPTLQTFLTMGLLAIEDRMLDLEQDYARTRPQIEALKRLIGAE